MIFQIAEYDPREFQSDSRDPFGNGFRGGSFPQSPYRTVFPQECGFPVFADAFDLIQNGIADGIQSQIPVIGDGKAVCFIPDRLKQFQGRAVMADHIRFRSARHKNKLKFFRQSDHGEGRTFHRNKSFQCRGKLTFSTVHHKEIRQGEVIFQQPFEMTGHRLFHHGKVVGSGHSLDPETAVVRFVRCAIGKMYQTCHCEGPGDIGDIETLNRPWRQIQFQSGLQIFHSSHSRCGIGDRGIFKSAVFLTVHRFDVGGNIPVQCGFFKLLFFRTFFHFQFQNFPHIFDVAVQYGDQLVHTRPVFFLRHLVFAGTAAIFQCSSQTMFAVVRSGIGSFTGA